MGDVVPAASVLLLAACLPVVCAGAVPSVGAPRVEVEVAATCRPRVVANPGVPVLVAARWVGLAIRVEGS